LSLRDAARVVALRSQAIRDSLAGRGGMVSVGLPVAEVELLLGRWSDQISVAVVNGPGSTVVSGDPASLDELVDHCVAQGVRVKRVPVDYGSHSVMVESIADELRTVLAPITPRSSTIPFLSTVTGDWVDTRTLDAEYWYRNLRQTVLFESAVRAVAGHGHQVFIEVSPHPVLAPGIQETLDGDGDGGNEASGGVALGTLRREDGGLGRFLRSLAEAHVHGVRVDWPAVFDGTGARLVDLPTYAFQRQRFWLESCGAGQGDVTAAGLVAADHPLLGAAVACQSPMASRSPAGCRCGTTRGLPTTRCWGRRCCQARPSSNSHSGQRTRPAAGASTSWSSRRRWSCQTRVGSGCTRRSPVPTGPVAEQ
jgi:acyl transferase domain-containing protein